MNFKDFQEGFPGRLVETSFIETRDGPSRTVVGEAFLPDALPPKLDPAALIGRLYSVLDRAKTNLLRLEAAVESLPEPKVLLSAMRSREAQTSSRIENTFASLREVAIAAVSEVGASSDAMDVFRNRRAIEAGLASKWPIGGSLLFEMHKILIIDPRKRPGRLRNAQVCIGDEQRGFGHARFVPPPPSHVEECFREWERFVRAAPQRQEEWPYLVSLAFSHYQFETIHPFSDGNGRLGRAIVNLSPVKDGFLRHPVCNLSEWVHDNRQEYYDRLLRVSTHGEWEPWLRFFCTALAEQALMDLQRADRVRKLYGKYHELVTTKRKSAVLPKLIDHLFANQAITIPDAAELLGMTYPAAQRHIEFLVNERVLVLDADSGNYGKVYVATPIIRAIRGQGED